MSGAKRRRTRMHTQTHTPQKNNYDHNDGNNKTKNSTTAQQSNNTTTTNQTHKPTLPHIQFVCFRLLLSITPIDRLKKLGQHFGARHIMMTMLPHDLESNEKEEKKEREKKSKADLRA
jgi:hypothetical protein